LCKSYETGNVYCDRAPGGELQMILDRDEVPEERQVARLLKQILDGIAFLHSLNVAHLDIKVSVFKHSNYVYMEKPDLTPTVSGEGVAVNAQNCMCVKEHKYIYGSAFSPRKVCYSIIISFCKFFLR